MVPRFVAFTNNDNAFLLQLSNNLFSHFIKRTAYLLEKEKAVTQLYGVAAFPLLRYLDY